MPTPMLGSWTEDRMTLEGAVAKCALLVAVTGASAVLSAVLSAMVPLLLLVLVALVVSLVLAVLTIRRPHLAPRTAVPYAVCEGVLVGFVSWLYAEEYGDGLVVWAVGITFSIVAVLLGLYRAQVVKVTENFKLAVSAATGGVALYYLVALLLRMFGAHAPLIASNTTWGLLFSALVIVIAAANLVTDFDFIEQGVERGLPRHMEWYAAFGLLVSLVWLYLEILRLLAKLSSRKK
jgi:uncharacterized YccA/Bax inhibitor family protein